MVSSGLAPHKPPRALDSLLIYQQPSSTTLYYSYQEHLFLTKARLRNETREITGVNTLVRVTHLASSGPSTPAGCIRIGITQEEPRHNIGLNCIRIDLHICWMLDRLATYKTPRALDSLLLYQQSSSTTSPCSYAHYLLPH